MAKIQKENIAYMFLETQLKSKSTKILIDGMLDLLSNKPNSNDELLDRILKIVDNIHKIYEKELVN